MSSKDYSQPNSTLSITAGTIIGQANQDFVLTGIGASTGTWIGINDTISATSWSPSPEHATLKVRGDAEFEDDITIKGKSLSKTLDGIEERLGILHTNSGLEERWSKLKRLGKQYRAMEADLLDKEKMWDILKK